MRVQKKKASEINQGDLVFKTNIGVTMMNYTKHARYNSVLLDSNVCSNKEVMLALDRALQPLRKDRRGANLDQEVFFVDKKDFTLNKIPHTDLSSGQIYLRVHVTHPEWTTLFKLVSCEAGGSPNSIEFKYRLPILEEDTFGKEEGPEPLVVRGNDVALFEVAFKD